MSPTFENILITVALVVAGIILTAGATVGVTIWLRSHHRGASAGVVTCALAAAGVVLYLPWLNGMPRVTVAPKDGAVSTTLVPGAGYGGQHETLATGMMFAGAALLICAAVIFAASWWAPRRDISSNLDGGQR